MRHPDGRTVPVPVSDPDPVIPLQGVGLRIPKSLP